MAYLHFLATGSRAAGDLYRSAAAAGAYSAVRILIHTPPSVVRWARRRPTSTDHEPGREIIRRFDDAYQDSPLRRKLQVRGNRCVYLPTCTEYAERAVAKYGLVRGLMIAGDRFRRCSEGGTGSYIEFP